MWAYPIAMGVHICFTFAASPVMRPAWTYSFLFWPERTITSEVSPFSLGRRAIISPPEPVRYNLCYMLHGCRGFSHIPTSMCHGSANPQTINIAKFRLNLSVTVSWLHRAGVSTFSGGLNSQRFANHHSDTTRGQFLFASILTREMLNFQLPTSCHLWVRENRWMGER